MTSGWMVVAVPGQEPWSRSRGEESVSLNSFGGVKGEMLKKRFAILVSQKRALGLRYKSGNRWHSHSFIHTFIHPADTD